MNQIKAKTLTRRVPSTTRIRDEADLDRAANDRLLEKAKRHDELKTLSDKVARSTIYVRNWKFNNAEKHYPHAPHLRCVDKYYQYAEGGPILFDEPRDKGQIELCLEKAKYLKEEGYRYAILELDTTLDMALSQIGAI